MIEWSSDRWHIRLEASNKKDEALLKKFYGRLAKFADPRYYEGRLTVDESDDKFKLAFHR